MKRRKFLTGSVATASGLLMGINACGTKEGKKVSEGNSVAKIDKLAGQTLEQLLEQYRYYLFDDFLPFLDKFVIDHEFGGFMCNTDRDGTKITTNKTARYEGRGIWVYSFLYDKLEKDPKYLEIARKSVEFILRNEPSGDNLWPESYSREGKSISKAPVTIYEDLFIANGLSEYSKASGEDKYWYKAKEILLKCLKIYNKPDYGYVVNYGPQADHAKGPRVLGHWMVIIRLVTQMLEYKFDPELEKIADECVDAIMNYHFNPEYNLFNELLNHDLSRPEGPFSQFVYTGHAIETLWMLMFEAVRRKDKKLFDLVAERFRRHVEVARDDVYGGVFRSLDNVNENVWKVDKVLWAQEEVLIGTLFIIEYTGAKWAKDMFEKMYNYVIDKYPLKQYGYPIWILGADRKVTFKDHTTRVGNFHHPRHLMLNILSLERMLERGGEVSGLF
ncbi:MAG: AGE family epimerase/isomerase [Bacteroidales bacterium]|nr:AGE family epimerase/isomerase [Bacteroidales bacterium]